MDCDHCGKEFDDEADRARHILDAHDDELTSHERDELKRTANRDGSGEAGAGVDLPVSRTAATALLGVAVLLVGGYALAATDVVSFSTGSGDDGTTTPTGGAVDIPVADEPVMGDPGANVTVVVYEDFQCPACKRFNAGTLPRVVSDYVETGDAKLVWKDFPLTQIHDWAAPAAAAMECVYRQDEDAFWTVKEQVYDNQGALSRATVQDRVVDWAAAEGVDRSALEACLQDPPESEINGDLQEGVDNGVSGTPTVFVNGKRVGQEGQVARYSQIADAIEAELQD